MLGTYRTAVAARLERLFNIQGKPDVPLGINLGKSKITPLEDASGDYLYSLKKLWPYGDYFVVNVSSPNTPGLRKLQDRESLEILLQTVIGFAEQQETNKPVLLKIAPDLGLEQIDEILILVEKHGVSGLIATNTTIAREDQIGGHSFPSMW